MHHDWTFELLHDLRDYAQKNGLTALAAKTGEALDVARIELGCADSCAIPGPAPPRRPH